MGQGLASFAAGFGGGYLGAQRQAKLDEERQQDRSMRQQEFDARMGEVAQAKNLRISLADAAAPRTTQEGSVVGGEGNREFYSDPSKVTPQMLEDRRIESEMRNEVPGAKPISLSDVKPGYGVSAGSRGQITTEKPNLAELNTPEARRARQVEAYDAAGKPAEAITLSNAVMDNKQKVQAQADNAMQRKIHSFNTPEEMTNFITEYPHDNMGGKLKASVVRSPDGKMWSVVGETADGEKINLPGEYTNDGAGLEKARIALAGRFGDPQKRVEFYKWDQELNRKLQVDANAARHQKIMEDAAVTTAGAAKTRAEGAGNAPPPGYRKTLDGNLEPIPGGPATTVKPVAEKPLNDTQSKALLFGSRMREADKILGRLSTEGTTTSVPGSRGMLGGVINAGSPGNSQMLDQAKRDFTNAVLRRESGAVIADSEFANADRQYFPQIGDSAKTVEQKANNRRLALDGILLEVPEAHRNTLQPRNADNAPLAMPKTITDMKPGSIYQTGRGPAKWNGTAFEVQ